MQMKRIGAIFLLLFVCAASAHGAQTLQQAVRTATTVWTTELNSKASNAWVTASSGINNIIGGAVGEGYMQCTVELSSGFAAAPSANSSLVGWFLKSTDTGSTYEDASNGTISLNRLPDFVIPLTTGQTTTKASVTVRCPSGWFKVVGQLSGSGQTTSASGNTLKIYWSTPQGN
jgi:hypothetical protein